MHCTCILDKPLSVDVVHGTVSNAPGEQLAVHVSQMVLLCAVHDAASYSPSLHVEQSNQKERKREEERQREIHMSRLKYGTTLVMSIEVGGPHANTFSQSQTSHTGYTTIAFPVVCCITWNAFILAVYTVLRALRADGILGSKASRGDIFLFVTHSALGTLDISIA